MQCTYMRLEGFGNGKEQYEYIEYQQFELLPFRLGMSVSDLNSQ